MKRILISLAMLFAVMNIIAQEHLSFMGIPITGSVMGFCQKLRSKGFTLIDVQSDATVFSGKFAGSDATVGVSDDGKNVFGVAVLFAPSGEWNTLVTTYDYYKRLYTRKYGKPTISEESNPARSNSNTALMSEVYQGTVEYSSVWKAAGGEIELSIESSGIYEGIVTIIYRDFQNIKIKTQKYIEDI